MAGLLSGGEKLPTDQLPGAKKRKVKSKKGLRPAFVRRVAGNHRKLAVHDLIRPVQTPTEVALFVHLLPSFRTGSKVNYWGMAIEFNNRILQAFNAGKPLDAYPKSSRELCQYGDAYVKQTREKDSLLMLGFTQALAPLSPPPPLIFSSSSMAGQQQAPAPFSSPHFLAASQSPHLAAMGPQYTTHAPAPHHPVTAAPQSQLAQAPAVNQAAAAAPQPQLAPIFQAQANAASGQKRLRDRSLGKGSNRGTARGGVGVGKTCQACSVIQGKPVQLTRAHQNACIYCTKCVVKSKGTNRQLKMVDGVPHNCPYK